MSDTGRMTEQLAESALLKLVSRWFIVAMGGAVAWMLLLMIELDKRDSVQTERLDNISKQIDDKTQDRYTSKDASIDKAKQANVDAMQNAALERIMERLDELLDESHNHKWPEYYGEN